MKWAWNPAPLVRFLFCSAPPSPGHCHQFHFSSCLVSYLSLSPESCLFVSLCLCLWFSLSEVYLLETLFKWYYICYASNSLIFSHSVPIFSSAQLSISHSLTLTNLSNVAVVCLGPEQSCGEQTVQELFQALGVDKIMETPKIIYDCNLLNKAWDSFLSSKQY